MSDLEQRVGAFNTLSLPGQPMGMHMGTSSLVNDLWQEVRHLRAAMPRLVDLTWGRAMEDESVPSTKIADEIIAAVTEKK